MYVSVDLVKNGLVTFVEKEIAAKATGVQKFLSYFAIPIVGKTTENYLQSFAKNPVTNSFFDGNGAVDIDALYNMAKEAVKKSGQFTVYGVILSETDIDKIYNYIKSF
jgi:hypothetical protein